MSANMARKSKTNLWALLVILVLIALWYTAPPRVVVYYADDATDSINYVLNTQNSIGRGDLHPGETTGDVGHIFPDKDFFMMLDWWSDSVGSHCVYITPKWPTTAIHIDRNGNLTQGTDKDRLTPCLK